jgi:hypothetical protein
MTRTRLPNGQYAKEQPRKDPERREYIKSDLYFYLEWVKRLQQVISNLRNQNAELSRHNAEHMEHIEQQQDWADTQDETIRQLRSRVLGHSISWFTIGVLLASVGFLIFQYLVK